MSEIFLKIINMSISASYIVLAVLLLRLLLKKAPKWITVVLWGIVAIRLVCPFSIESVLSLIPSSEVVSPDIMMDRTPEINTGIPVLNQVINPVISGSFTPNPGTSANPLQLWIPTFAVIWIIGIPVLMVGVLSVIMLGLTTSELGIKLSTLSMEKGQTRRTATIPQRTTVIHLGAFFSNKRKRSTASTI